jgi:predicted secreted protein
MPAPASTKIRGYEGQLYYQIGAGTNTLWANVTDITVDVKADDLDASDHATVGWKDKMSGLKEWTGKFKANFMQSGVDVLALYAALTGATNLVLEFRPQDVTGGIQYTGTCVIVDWSHADPNSGLQTVDISVSGRGALVLGTVTTGGSA